MDASILERWLITTAVMLVTVIEILDITIVNVVLPHMMGALSATPEQIAWVLTSYIVSAAVFMPLTGFLVKRFGQKRLLLCNIVGFLTSSILCGLSQSLAEIVLFRTFQGIFGASLLPLSQLILNQTFPLEERGKAMAVWGIGVMAGPVLGPTLGGYISELLNWRWIFFINIPVCIIAFIMSVQLIKESPIKKEPIDWFGMALMSTGIGCFQIFLDRGNIEDWFDSNTICWLFAICIVSLTCFIWRGVRIPNNIINLQLYRNRNFWICSVAIAIFSAGFFGIIAIQPLLIEEFMGYPPDLTGLVLAPRGLTCAIAMLFASRLMLRYDMRIIIASGLIFASLGCYLMSYFNLVMDMHPIIWVGAIQGLGMGLFFVPISTICYSTLSKSQIAEAIGLFNFGRSLGSSVGISLCNTLLSRYSQANWNRMSQFVLENKENLHLWLDKRGLSLLDPSALKIIANNIFSQCHMIAFINIFSLVAINFFILLPFIYFLKNTRHTNTSTMLH